MGLPNANQQIVAAYETCNLTVEQIAENFEMNETAVKATLISGSPKYRRAMREAEAGESLDVSSEETKAMLDIIKGIAHEQRTSMPGVALRAAQFVFNEGKGRNNLQGLNTTNLNVIVVNQKLQGMKAARERVMKIAQRSSQDENVTIDADAIPA